MLKIDLHVHTVHSGDSPCEVREAITAAKENGLDGIAITDHDSVSGLEEALNITREEEFLIIPGIEVSSDDGHILGLGIKKTVPSGLPAAETVKKIKEKGGVTVSAHPFSLDPKPFSILKANFDAVEIFNSRRYVGNKLAKKYTSNHNLHPTGGSDAHFCDEIGLAGVKLNCEPTVKKVLEKIRNGKASIFGRYLPLSHYMRAALFRLRRL